MDYSPADQNIYKIVNQLEIQGFEKRIPDGILYINGLPLVVFEFKSAIRDETTIHDAYMQLTATGGHSRAAEVQRTVRDQRWGERQMGSCSQPMSSFTHGARSRATRRSKRTASTPCSR